MRSEIQTLFSHICTKLDEVTCRIQRGWLLIVIASSLILVGTDELSCHIGTGCICIFHMLSSSGSLTLVIVCVYIQSWHFYFTKTLTPSSIGWNTEYVCLTVIILPVWSSTFNPFSSSGIETKWNKCLAWAEQKRPSEMIKKSITHLGTIPRAFIELLWPIRENDFHTHDQCNFHIKYTILTWASCIVTLSGSLESHWSGWVEQRKKVYGELLPSRPYCINLEKQ